MRTHVGVRFAILLSVLLVACKKDIHNYISSSSPATFSEVFDEFWNNMNVNYVYWDIDTTNWDAVYRRYKPLFAQLDINNVNDERRSVAYFRQITGGLTDNHYSIRFLPATITDSFLFPALEKKSNTAYFHSPFVYVSVDSNYFDKGFIIGNYSSPTNEQVSAVCATIQNKILYFGCDKFALYEAYNDAGNNGVKTTLQYFFNQLQNLPSNIKALFIDVRNNSGGNIEDLNFLIGKIINEPLHFGYTHYKSGNGRLAFTPWIDANVIPSTNNDKPLGIPIFVLGDAYSISLAEIMIMAIHAIPNNAFIGEKTWGATGPITNNIIYNDGQFNVPNFLSVYTSSVAFKYIDGNSYEGKGFPPDIYVPFDLTALLSGNDPLLNKAISLVK